MDNKTNSKDNNNINGENNNFVEKIINKLLVQKNNNLNINSDNISLKARIIAPPNYCTTPLPENIGCNNYV